MMLPELIADLPVRVVRGEPARVRICDLTEDSRTAVPGSLFVARRGLTVDGRRFAAQAAAAGAVAVLTDDPAALGELPAGCCVLVSDNVPAAAAELAERMFGNPSTTLHLIGVTGTNGKSTVAHLVHRVLNAAGLRCGLIGTIEIDDGRERVPAAMTTPGSIEISRTLESMVEAGCEAAVMEVSSHALHQQRVAALRFDVGVFTNLTGDHLDYHGTMEAYAAAKRMLFEQVRRTGGLSIINIDDEHGPSMAIGRYQTCTVNGQPDADWSASIATQRPEGMELDVRGPGFAFRRRVELIGVHNAMNALQALAAASAVLDGADRAHQLADAITLVGPPAGRLERVSTAADGITVLVDYAHTDDALDHALRAVRAIVPEGAKLTVVFGCGGDRDRHKRPRMGAAAASQADRIIITSDNPRSEPPSRIIDDIVAGIAQDRRAALSVHVDRGRAIAEAVRNAAPGDVVLIAGKGHETDQVAADETGRLCRTPFDDREVARAALRSRREIHAP